MWLDASNDGSLTLNGNTVSEWRDLSGNGRHVAQATPASQPNAVNRTQNGRRVLDYTGGQEMLGNAATLGFLRNVSGATIIAAVKWDALSTISLGYTAVIFSSGANSTQARAALGSVAPVVSSLSGGGRRVDADSFNRVNGTGTTNPRIASAVFDYANSDAFIYAESSLAGSNTSFQTTGNTSDTDSLAVSVGGGNGANLLDGWIGEVLVWPRVLTDAQRLQVERYLGRKWGITVAPQVSNTDAQDWVNRVYANGGTVSSTTATAVNTFCNAIDAAGLRDRFYRLNLFCGTADASLIAVRTPLYRGQSLGGTQFGNTLDTNVNFAITDYAETGASGGLLGDGTSKYLSTGLTPAAIPEIATGHLSAYIPSLTPGSSRSLLGAASGSQRFEIFQRLTGGNLVQFRAMWGGTVSSDDTFGAGVTTLPGGLWTSTRTSSIAITTYNNATSKVTGTTSTTPATHANGWFVYATNSAGTAASFANHRILSYSIGAGMTAQQVSDYNAAIQAFQAAMGRDA
jgi:hypothetical protein